MTVKTTKEICLENLKKGKDTPTKLMWQNVYFWHLRNEAYKQGKKLL